MPKKVIRHCWFAGWSILVVTLVCAAVLLTLARLLLPLTEDYRPDIEAWVSKVVDQPMEIASLDAGWRGFEPQLVLRNVKFIDEQSNQPTLEFGAIKIGFNLFESLRHWELTPGVMVVEGASLMAIRNEDGSFSIGHFVAEGKMENQDSSKLSDWLLSRETLSIESSRLIWEDRKRGRPPRELQVKKASLSNDVGLHHLHGEFELPEELGRALTLTMEFDGDPFSGKNWRGRAYVSADNLQMANWLLFAERQGIDLNGGVASVFLWSDWQNGELSSAYGSLDARDVLIQSNRQASLIGIDQLSTDFSIAKKTDHWRFVVNDFSLRSNDRIWPSSRFVVKAEDSFKKLDMQLSHIDAAVVTDVLKLLPREKQQKFSLLIQSSPTGSIESLSASLDMNAEPANFQFYGKIKNFTSKPVKKIPGVSGLDADFAVSQNGGFLHFDDRNMSLTHIGLFDQKIRLDHFMADVSWTQQDQSWLVNVNAPLVENNEVSVSTHGRFVFTKDKKPFVDVVARLNKAANVEQATAYLPVGIMPEKTVVWVRSALLKGKVTGDFVMHGDMADFPFSEQQGRFALKLGIDEGTLHYRDGWPDIASINGDFILNANGLSFHSNHARIYNNALEKVDLNIANFRNQPRLIINGRAIGPSSDKFKYMHVSGLEELFAKHIKPIEMQGESDLDLHLEIPLKPESGGLSVSGEVLFRDNRFVAKPWLLDFNHVNGRLRFDKYGIYAEKLQAEMGDNIALQLDINTVDVDPASRSIVISHTSELSDTEFAYLFQNFAKNTDWSTWLSGRTQVNAEVEIPISGEGRPVTISLRSLLQGMELNLPVPLQKSRELEKPLIFKLALGHDNYVLNINYDIVHAVLEFASAGGDIVRGAVGFDEVVTLPEEHGFRFIGSLNAFFWSEWEPILFPDPGQPALLRTSGVGASQYFDVKVQELELFGSHFNKAIIHASKTAQGWSIRLDGPQLEGDIFVPIVSKSAPLRMDMKKIIIRSQEVKKTKAQLDPRNMPEFVIKSDFFQFNDVKFGRLDLKTTRIANGMQLNKLEMKSGAANINAKGEWSIRQDEQVSTFEIKAKSDNMGRSLADWGYAETISGGNGKIDLNVSWPGKPTDFGFETLTGKVKLDLTDGRLLDVSPGAARMFGLLSIQALPRRLLLDFRDVFAKGMQFDTMNVEFDVQNGSAYTNNFVMDGTSAKIEMAGKIGLAGQYYDQIVSVTPKVGATIPLIGALASGVPQVGATLFLFQKLFEKQIDDVSTVQYSITGTWQDPVITKIQRPVANTAQDEILE